MKNIEKNNYYKEIFKGQFYKINGELYDFRVTNVRSSTNFLTTAFFRSQNPKSSNPFFEEQIKRIIGNSEFEIYKKYGKI